MWVQGKSSQDDRAAEQASFSRKVAAERAAQRAQARAGLGRANKGRRELDCSLLQVLLACYISAQRLGSGACPA